MIKVKFTIYYDNLGKCEISEDINKLPVKKEEIEILMMLIDNFVKKYNYCLSKIVDE